MTLTQLQYTLAVAEEEILRLLRKNALLRNPH